MKNWALWIIAGLAVVALCSAPRAASANKDEQEIRALEDRFATAFRAKQDFFSAFPGAVDKFEVQDLSIVTDGKLAYSHSIQPAIVTAKDGSKFSLTVRVTDCYRKVNGRWLITQEHLSVPVDLESGKPDLASKP